MVKFKDLYLDPLEHWNGGIASKLLLRMAPEKRSFSAIERQSREEPSRYRSRF